MSDPTDDSFSLRLNKAAGGSDASANAKDDIGELPSPKAPAAEAAPPFNPMDSFAARLGSHLGQAAEPEQQAAAQADPDSLVQAQACGAGEHEVAPGECLAGIARKAGHDWQTIWDDSANTQIRESRQDPNLLLAGDRLHVPPQEAKQEPAATEARHRFVLHSAPVQLVLQLKDEEGKPRANKAYTLDVAGAVREGYTDPSGTLREYVDPDAREALLTLTETGETFPLRLGALQTAEAIAGVQARLNNLGFHCGPVTGTWNEHTRSALKAFQSKQGLPVHGELDQATLQRLRNVHRS